MSVIRFWANCPSRDSGMTFWLDEQISPLAPWIEMRCDVICHSVVNLPVDRGDDEDIFMSARKSGAIIIRKDSDFVDLINRLGQPPQVLWVTCGNRSNASMKELLDSTFPQAIKLLDSGESIVELA